jgi:endonuclease/exonuclease/phosphatase family metal-dependent hydrolase
MVSLPRPASGLARRIRRHARWLAVALAVSMHRAWTVGPHCGRDDATIEVLDWNLENFPGDHDVDGMRDVVSDADPVVFAAQEINDPDALARLWPDASWSISEGGGVRGQRLGAGTRTATIDRVVEHAAFTLGGRVRPAMSMRVTTHGRSFDLVVVHLKAKADGAPLRRLQWLALVQLVMQLRAASDAGDLVVMGDFNTAGRDGVAVDERELLTHVLAGLGLRAVDTPPGCTAYWDGARRDAWLEPSTLDLVFVAGFADASVSARALGACAAHRCAAIRSSADHPDPALHATSDHCPILLEITP